MQYMYLALVILKHYGGRLKRNSLKDQENRFVLSEDLFWPVCWCQPLIVSTLFLGRIPELLMSAIGKTYSAPITLEITQA